MPERIDPVDPAAAAALEIDAATLLDLSLDGFMICDPSGRILQCNRACLKLHGVEAEDFLGKYIYDFDLTYPPDVVLSMLEQAKERGYIKGESKVRRADGHAIDIAFTCNFIPNEQGGCFFVFFTDITERKRAEAALRESEHRWRSLAEGVNAALFMYQDGRLVYANQGASKITGYGRDELIGMPVSRLMDARYQALYASRVNELKQEGTEATHYRGPLLTRNGDERWVALSLAESLFNQQPAILGVAFDITDQVIADGALRESRKDMEVLAREMAGVEVKERRALGSLLHDGLVQDLAACRLLVGNLPQGAQADPRLASDVSAAVKLLDAAIAQARNVINDLALPVLFQFGIDAALAQLCRDLAVRHGVEITFEANPDPKPLDEALLEVAYRGVRELLLNACRHASASRILVQSERRDHGLALTVADDGCGFDPSHLRRTIHGGEAGFGLFFLPRGYNEWVEPAPSMRKWAVGPGSRLPCPSWLRRRAPVRRKHHDAHPGRAG